MNIRRKSKLTSEVSTSSLNDIMFFLLLFFLIASTMANPNVIKVLLPKGAGVQEYHKKKPLSLTVNQDMEYFLGDNKIPQANVKSELQNKLANGNNDLSVVLRVDGHVEWQYVAELLEIGKELNVKMVAAARKK